VVCRLFSACCACAVFALMMISSVFFATISRPCRLRPSRPACCIPSPAPAMGGLK
jgi:hypothetical protein